jgi:hypothetical protein
MTLRSADFEFSPVVVAVLKSTPSSSKIPPSDRCTGRERAETFCLPSCAPCWRMSAPLATCVEGCPGGGSRSWEQGFIIAGSCLRARDSAGCDRCRTCGRYDHRSSTYNRRAPGSTQGRPASPGALDRDCIIAVHTEGTSLRPYRHHARSRLWCRPHAAPVGELKKPCPLNHPGHAFKRVNLPGCCGCAIR